MGSQWLVSRDPGWLGDSGSGDHDRNPLLGAAGEKGQICRACNKALLMFSLCVCWSLSRVLIFVTPWTVAHQAPLSVGILQARIQE